jgi:H/ACA ribonucleoprotein complex subunit 2
MADSEQKSGKKRARPTEEEAAPASSAKSDAPGSSKKSRTVVQGPMAPIAHPMAGKKLHKKLYKVVSKAAKAKVLRRGVKEVVKAIRKGQTGCVPTLRRERTDHARELRARQNQPC